MKKSGVQEWANHSINLEYTCNYACKYCYAKKLNKRFKFIPKEPVIKHYNGVIMFPTMHDINYFNFDKCADTIELLLAADNKILIVSKMSTKIAEKFIEKFKDNNKKENLEFRITINSLGSNLLRLYYEPFAPNLTSRLTSFLILKYHFNVSVSIEPLLTIDTLEHFTKTVNLLFKHKYQLWVGCLTNYKLNPDIPEEKAVIDLYKTLPEIYEEYKQYDFIKWKDSFFKAMNKEIKRRENKKWN